MFFPFNKLKFGNGQNSNKTIEASLGLGTANAKLRYNTATSKWEFSNDGTSWTEFGSGGSTPKIAMATNTGLNRAYTSTSYSDGSITTNGTFSVVQNIGSIGTIAQLLDGSLDHLPGITFTPAEVGTYKIKVKANGYGAATNSGYGVQLLDGVTVRDYNPNRIIHTGGDPSFDIMECIAEFSTLTGRDFKLQYKLSAGSYLVTDIFAAQPVLRWFVEKL